MTKTKRDRAYFIAKGLPGKIFIVLQGAFDLASSNTNEKGEPKPFEGTKLENVKNPKNIIYSKGKESGTYWKLDQNDNVFKQIHATAKEAMNDIDKLAYTDGVKKAIDSFVSIPNLGRGKGAGLKENSLKGLKL